MPPAKRAPAKRAHDSQETPAPAEPQPPVSATPAAASDATPDARPSPASDKNAKKVGDTVVWSEEDYYSPFGDVIRRAGLVTGVVDGRTDGDGNALAPVLEVQWFDGGTAAIPADQVA